MAYTVNITDLPTLQIGKADVRFSISNEGGKIGTLLVSKGGIEWRPTKKHERRSNWKEFDTTMRERWGDKKKR